MIPGRPAISRIGILVVLGFMHLGTGGASCFAQCSGAKEAGIAAGSDLVPEDISIFVEVSDKSGQPISGLQATDFKVFDNKQSQKILTFQAIDAADPPVVPVKLRIIIDTVNSDAIVVARERDGLSAFLKQNGGRLNYQTSIWMLGNDGLTRIAGPSQDGAALLAGLNEAPTLLRVINRSAGLWGAVERTDQAIKIVKEMVSTDSRTQGRKLFLFLSPGWPMLFNFEPDQRKWVFDDITRISNGLRESCISFYTLDPSSAGTNVESVQYDNFLKGVAKIGDAQYGDLSLQVLSEHSGGKVIIGGNDIKGEINTALRDAGAYYQLSFVRASGGRESLYHDIRVIVDKPRVKVHTTAGYYLVGP